ncbi:Sulfotransferase domain protein [Dirofilaria immitis]|nr:Sulfotransferase domain protein [Dirofilaria immitis]
MGGVIGRLFVGGTHSLARSEATHVPNSASCSLEDHENAFVFQLNGQPKQSCIDNEIWPPVFKPEFVRSAKSMIPRDTDIFVCTYPKCGTTWIQHICSQLLTDNYGPKVGRELCITSPMIERMGAKFADNLDSPRLLKTHFTWHNVPKNRNAKYILAVRNPKDCLTSWLPHIEDENVLFLKYEDMCANLPQAIIKIGEFLGDKGAKSVRDEAILNQIVTNSTIKSMKQDQWRWFPENNLRQNIFIRKGGSGDWRNYFRRDQSDRLDATYRKYLAGTVAEHWWEEEMAWDNVEEDIGIEGDLSFISTAEECISNSISSSRRGSLEYSRGYSIESIDPNF